MRYSPDSPEGRFLAGERAAVAEAVRWISRVLAAPSFWALREERTDLCQDVMRRVIESLQAGRFDPSRDFRAYVQGVARFTGFTAIGRRPRDEVPLERPGEEGGGRDPASGEPDPEDRAVARRVARFVLDRASETCRELLVAYFLEQKDYAELAEETGHPVGTLKSRLFRCLDGARLAIGGRAAVRGG